MRLLFITQNYPPNKGGMATSCDRLVRNFRKNNVYVDVIHFTNRQKPFHTTTQLKGTYSTIPINRSEEFTLALAAEFIANLPFLKDVTHLVAFGGTLPINLTPILAQYHSKPLVTMIRGNDFDEHIFSKKRAMLLYALEESSFIFTVTQEKKDKILKLVTHKNVFFSPNSIDTTLWSNPQKSQSQRIKELKATFNGKKIIGIVGQLKPKKGVLSFLQTFKKFPHRHNYVICLIGDIDESVKNKIDTLELEIIYKPFVHAQDLLIHYHVFDIVAIPSYYDGMPNVLLEAGATNNLIIGSNIGGIKDVITHKENGFLYQPLQPNALLDVLMNVHKLNDEQTKVIQRNLVQHIENNYTEKQEINNYLNHLK